MPEMKGFGVMNLIAKLIIMNCCWLMVAVNGTNAAEENIVNILGSKATWVNFKWNNVSNSQLYKNQEWKVLNMEEGSFIMLFEGKVMIGSKPVTAYILKKKDEDNYPISFQVKDSESDLETFQYFLNWCQQNYGNEFTYYDGTSKYSIGASFALKVYQWEINDTRISLYLKGVISEIKNAGIKDVLISGINIRHKTVDKKWKPLILIKCNFRFEFNDGEVSKLIETIYAIDENDNTVKNLENQRLKFNVSINENNIHMEIDEKNRTIKQDINRITGSLTGRAIEKQNNITAGLVGTCEKLEQGKKRF